MYSAMFSRRLACAISIVPLFSTVPAARSVPRRPGLFPDGETFPGRPVCFSGCPVRSPAARLVFRSQVCFPGCPVCFSGCPVRSPAARLVFRSQVCFPGCPVRFLTVRLPGPPAPRPFSLPLVGYFFELTIQVVGPVRCLRKYSCDLSRLRDWSTMFFVSLRIVR